MSGIARFRRPYDVDEVDRVVRVRGAAVLQETISESLCGRVCAELDELIGEHYKRVMAGREPTSEISHGRYGFAVHSLVNKIASISELITQQDILSWASRMLSPFSDTVLLGAAVYLERKPGEPVPQGELKDWHRGTEVWPHVPIGRNMVSVHAIIALVPFTVENGALWLAMDSHWLPDGEQVDPSSQTQVFMNPGDVTLLRSDLIHCAGANSSSEMPRRTLSLRYQADWLRPLGEGCHGDERAELWKPMGAAGQ